MDIRDRSVEAIVLRAKDYRDQDRLLTLVSAQAGPELAIARGARKSGASQAALAQPFSRINVLLSPAKGGVSFVREGRQEESFLPPGGDVTRFAYLSYFSELLLAVWPQGRVAPELYGLTLAACTLLKLDGDLARTARWFELSLLQALGLLPELAVCARCGLSQGQGEGRFYCLSPAQGALLCPSCAGADPAPRLSPGALKTAQALLQAPLTRLTSIRIGRIIGQELEEALDYYLSWQVEQAAPAKKRLLELRDF